MRAFAWLIGAVIAAITVASVFAIMVGIASFFVDKFLHLIGVM